VPGVGARPAPGAGRSRANCYRDQVSTAQNEPHP